MKIISWKSYYVEFFCTILQMFHIQTNYTQMSTECLNSLEYIASSGKIRVCHIFQCVYYAIIDTCVQLEGLNCFPPSQWVLNIEKSVIKN